MRRSKPVIKPELPPSFPLCCHLFTTMPTPCSPRSRHSGYHKVNTMLPPCLPHSGLDAAQIFPVPSNIRTFFVLSRRSTKNVAAGSDFVRNRAQWLWGQRKDECVQAAQSESDLRPHAELPPSRHGAAHNSVGDSCRHLVATDSPDGYRSRHLLSAFSQHAAMMRKHSAAH